MFTPEPTMYALLLALAPAAPPEPPGAFVVVSAEEERPPAKLVRFTPEFTATIATRTGEVGVKDVISLRRSGRPLPPFPTGPHLVTANGERIVGELLGGDKSLRFMPRVADGEGEPWLVPLSAVAALWLTD